MNDKMESICNPLTLDDLTSRVRISTITCLCSLLKDKDSKKSINLTRLYKSIDESELP